jgi:hypothetical protein
MLYRQPSSKGPARKSWEATLGLQYFGPAKVVKERVGWGEGSRFRLDCTSQEKAAHGHVVYAVQEGVKNGVKWCPNGSYCPGNDRCAGDYFSLAPRFLWAPRKASR